MNKIHKALALVREAHAIMHADGPVLRLESETDLAEALAMACMAECLKGSADAVGLILRLGSPGLRERVMNKASDIVSEAHDNIEANPERTAPGAAAVALAKAIMRKELGGT